MAETAIIGSILVNALLVLGLVIIAGARRERDGVMRFSPRLPNDTATLLLISSFIIVLIGLTNAAHDPASHHNRTISIIGAVALLVVYAMVDAPVPDARISGPPDAGGGAPGARWR